MGNEHAKPSDRLRYIDREVNSLRSSVRSTRRAIPKETKEDYIQNLVKLSTDASELKGKVKQKYIEHIQKNITNTMNEILTKSQDSELDLGAVETSSFVQMPVNKRQATNKETPERPTKKQKSSQVDYVKRGVSTLQEIEDKFRALKPQIDVAIQNKDTTQLRVHQQTIKVLVTDLEMIEVFEDTPVSDRKKKLDNSITAQYQRISKAVKEIKRNKDINYLAKQNKKEKAVKELEEIQKKLVDAESLLKWSLKNDESGTIKGIQEDLIAINQQLSSVEVPDETTKTMKMQLMDKITWFYKYINDTSKNSSQGDLSKAQANYEDIVRNIASGKNKDKEEIKAKLESLQSFINDIKGDDENSLRRKQQLLNNVKQSFSFILEDKAKQTTTDSIPKKPDSSYKEVDGFYNSWKTIQKQIKSTTYTSQEVLKIDKMLEDIQNSIAQTRLHITENRSLNPPAVSPTNLTKNLNNSTPNLSVSKSTLPKFGSSLSVDHAGPNVNKSTFPKFGSSLSVDHAGQSLIKTRVKVYNLSTPEIQNINDQPVVLRNKEFYKSNLEVTDENRFSKIEEIKTQVNYIKEKFPESQQKQHLKNKLESYRDILESYVHHKNQTVANNSKLVLSDIHEMLKSLSHIEEAMNTTSQRRLSIEASFENLAGIQEVVERLQKSVNSFSGKKGDHEYKKIKDELLGCRRCLEDTNVPPQYGMIQQQKDEILKKLNLLLHTLENKRNYEDINVAKTRKSLNGLKEKVNRFSGGYKGVLYNQIEKDLNKLLVDISETIEDKDIADEIIKEAEKHLKILENRATRDQSFRRTINEGRTKNENEEKLAKLKSDLLDIKKAIDTTPTNGVNLFLGLKSRLDLVKLGLDQLKFSVEDEEKHKDILYNEVETLKNVVDAKIALAKQSIRQWPLEQDKHKRDEEELGKIEEKFRSLKPEIENFVGTTSDNKFYELDENSIKLVLRMDRLQFAKGTDIHNRKINLLKDIYNYGDLLDKRAKETEDIVEIEREIYDLEKNFERYLRLDDVDNLLEKISTLKKKIKNNETNRNLTARKHVCAQKVDALFNKATGKEEKDGERAVLRKHSDKNPATEIAKIEQQFSLVKKEIDDFVGIHADRKYYELNGSLTALFPKLDNLQLPEGSELQARKISLLKTLHLYCDILDKKAKETEIVREINKQLNAVNSKVDDYKNTNEELKVMETELKSVQTKLEKFKISDQQKTSLRQKFEILFGEYNRLKKAKQQIPKDNYIGSSSFLADVQNLSKGITPQSTQSPIQAEVDEIQREIDGIRSKVSTFVNSDTSEEYNNLEEDLLRLKLRASKLLIPRGDALYNVQLNLEKSIQDCLNILDERAQEVDALIDIERELDRIKKKFENPIANDEQNAIDEKLIFLQVKLGKLKVNDDLTQRKNMYINRILVYLKQLKEKSAQAQPNSEDEHAESFV